MGLVMKARYAFPIMLVCGIITAVVFPLRGFGPWWIRLILMFCTGAGIVGAIVIAIIAVISVAVGRTGMFEEETFEEHNIGWILISLILIFGMGYGIIFQPQMSSIILVKIITSWPVVILGLLVMILSAIGGSLGGSGASGGGGGSSAKIRDEHFKTMRTIEKGGTIQGGTIHGQDGRVVGEITEKGVIWKGHDRIGKITNDGRVYDRDGERVGEILDDGRVYDRDGERVGEILDDGRVYDRDGERVGKNNIINLLDLDEDEE